MKTTNTSFKRIVYLNGSLCDQPLAYHSSEKGVAICRRNFSEYSSKRMNIIAPWRPPTTFYVSLLLLCTYIAQNRKSCVLEFRSIRSILVDLGKTSTSPKYYKNISKAIIYWSKVSIEAKDVSIPLKDRYVEKSANNYNYKKAKRFIGKYDNVNIKQVFVSQNHDKVSGTVRIELSKEWLKLCGRKPLATVDIDAATKIQAPYSLNLLLYLSAYQQKIRKDRRFPRKIRYLARALGIKKADTLQIKELYRKLKKACADVSTATGIPYKLNPRLKEELIDLTIDKQPADSDSKLCIHNNTINVRTRKRTQLVAL